MVKENDEADTCINHIPDTGGVSVFLSIKENNGQDRDLSRDETGSDT